jgi:type IX secretion system PorP/SprF family membrane protein
MKSLKIILIVLILIPLKAFSQQDPMYSLYVFNGLLLNPAYAGTQDALNATMLYRNQWVNIPGAPKTGVFSLDAPIRNQKVGLGLNVEFDKIGVSNHTGVLGAYSYKIKFVNSTLSFGVQAGIGFSNTNFTSVKYTDQGVSDEAFQANYNDILPNFGFGLYYYADKFYAGFSIPQIAGKTLQNAFYGNSESTHLDLANHYFLTSGYLFTVSPDVKLKPSFLLKYVNGSPMEFDINGVAWFYDLLAVGVSYRSLASVDFLGQLRVSNQLYIGYAYEYATNNLNNFSSGSHEVMVRYLFNFSRAKIVTPRFF